MPIYVAVDIGTTTLKVGLLDDAGDVDHPVVALDAGHHPFLSQPGAVRDVILAL